MEELSGYEKSRRLKYMIDPPEHLTETNRDLQPLIKILYKLREIEHSKKPVHHKFAKAKPLLLAISRVLHREQNFLLHRMFWEELHDRMSYYYDYLNRKNTQKSKIPLYRITLHNEAVSWWLDAAQKGKLVGPLLHFDTHDDMGLPANTYKLLDKNGNLKKPEVKKGACRKINYPVTCILLSKKINQVMWLMPKWVYDDDQHYEQYLVACHKDLPGACVKGDILYLRPKGQKKDLYMLKPDVKLIEKKKLTRMNFKFIHKFDFHRVHTEKVSYWKKLAKAIKPQKKFILDIDLDYFVTNGDKVSKKIYQKEFNDLESCFRTHEMPGVRSPQEIYDDHEARKYARRLTKELKEIDERIEIFLDGLAYLKKQGITPSVINMSDSTPAMLVADHKRASITNNYAPKYFVPYLHTSLILGFKRLYPKSFI